MFQPKRTCKHLPVVYILFFFFITPNIRGQGNFNNWYFGKGVGITFNNTPPTLLPASPMVADEGCAVISNNAGALLFYTDGVTVWDRNHNIMPNGTGLIGSSSTAQSAVIVPMPGDADKYYVFHHQDASLLLNGELRYSIVDITLNGGNGDIMSGAKNIFLSANNTEVLVSANATNCGIWVIAHQKDNNRFDAFLVTSSGIRSPVSSNAGSIHNSRSAGGSFTNTVGTMKVSRNNKKIGVATTGLNEVFDFDAATGQISNAISLPMAARNTSYGTCFSPDDTKIYFTNSRSGSGFNIFQYDLSSGNAVTIINSKSLVGTATMGAAGVGDLQLGPDDKIYFTKFTFSYLGVIPSPNLIAPLCGFIDDGLALGTGFAYTGLPNQVRAANPPKINLGNDTTLCPNASLTITAPAAVSYVWSTGATGQSIPVATPGKYWVEISDGFCTSADTINVAFSLPQLELGKDTTICQPNAITLNGGAATSYAWSTGDVTPTITVNNAGKYWVDILYGLCSETDTINISVDLPPAAFSLGNDTTLCAGQNIQLTSGVAAKYEWNTGAATKSIVAKSTGRYWVQASEGNCTTADTINVTFKAPPPPLFPSDTTVCKKQLLLLDAGNALKYVWSTGDTTQTINVSQRGHYTVTVNYYPACTTQYVTNVNFENCEYVLLMPNAFSPNKDGINEVFKAADFGGYKFTRFSIYNRWGQQVFETGDLHKGWDGKLNGVEQGSGLFVWMVVAYKDGQKKVFKGTVMLIR